MIRTRLAGGEALTLVPVAAILVASIRLHFLDLTLNAQSRGPTVFPCDVDVGKGDELGWFEHGSTIIVLAPGAFRVLRQRGGIGATAGRPAAVAQAVRVTSILSPRGSITGGGRDAARNRRQGREMARTPVLAAGGIVLRQEMAPLIAVVRLRKRNEWVLPKGKLDDGETPRAAAEREVREETGHDVAVHEFLGTLVYESGGRSRVVHYWRMEANGGQVHPLMKDVRAVDWLPLDVALVRLSRDHERAFLANVGPLAFEAAATGGIAGRPEPRRTEADPALPEPGKAAAEGPRSNPVRKLWDWLRGAVRADREAVAPIVNRS